jgi:hypothetical protein
MKRFFTKVLLGLGLAVLTLGAAATPAFASCDNGVPDGGEARNSGNGCIYRCSGSSWSGPLRCDGQGNGQFQGPPAQSAEERANQARAVQQAAQDAERVVSQQGAAATAAQAASTAEQRAKEATRQQAMVEAQRQTELDVATRLGATPADIAKIEADARAAAAFVAQAQGTNRGQNIVGSGAANAEAIAAAGYDPSGALATGNVSVSGGTITGGVTRVAAGTGGSGGGGTGHGDFGSDAANAAMYTGADKCDINGGGENVAPGGACCRGGKVECAGSGVCSAGSVGQSGRCSTSGLVAGDPEARAVAFRNSNGTVTSIPVLTTGSSCAAGTRSCSYANGVVCVNSSTYSDANGGCTTWQRDVTSQTNRGSSEIVVSSSNTCTGATRGCHYGGGWVCVDRARYPENNFANGDTSNGCGAWSSDFRSTNLVGGSVKFKVVNGSCVSCATGDSASVCAYSTLSQCNSGNAIVRAYTDNPAAAAVRYRLNGGTCVACTTQLDATQYDCQYTTSTCGGRAGANSNVAEGGRCTNGPCYCPSTGAQIASGTVCPTEREADRTPNCPASSNRVIAASGSNRSACLQGGIIKYLCNTGTSADGCTPPSDTATSTLPIPATEQTRADTYCGRSDSSHNASIPTSSRLRCCGNSAVSSTNYVCNTTSEAPATIIADPVTLPIPATEQTRADTYCASSTSSHTASIPTSSRLRCCGNVAVSSTNFNCPAATDADLPTTVVADPVTLPIPATEQNTGNAFCAGAGSASDAYVTRSSRLRCCGDVAVPSAGYSCPTPIDIADDELTPVIAPAPNTLRCSGVHGQPTGSSGAYRYCCNGTFSPTECTEPVNLAISTMNGQTFQSTLPVRAYCGTPQDNGECSSCRDRATYEVNGRLYCRYAPRENTNQVDALNPTVLAPANVCAPEGQEGTGSGGSDNCCGSATLIAELQNGQTKNVCRSYSNISTINQDGATGVQVCSDADGCLCRQQGGNVSNHVAEGIACPDYRRVTTTGMPECSGETVVYGSSYSNPCKVGFGLAATCRTGFRIEGGACVAGTVVASVTSAICRISPNLPQCPNNPNGQYLSIGGTCASNAQCHCNGGFMNGNVCTAYESLTLGQECSFEDSSHCRCAEGKMVGNKCSPRGESSYCFSLSGSSTSCNDGYRYRCNLNNGPVGQNTWTGETCNARACVPNAVQCQSDTTFKICKTDGTGWLENNSCGAHTVCVQSSGRCVDNRPLEILGNECRLQGEREYAVNLPQCSNGSYVCQNGVSKLINGRYVCPSPTGSYSHGCTTGMYFDAAANECRYNPSMTTGQESYAGYQCSNSGVNAGNTSFRVCQACGRAGQPACTNCYDQDPNSGTFCAPTLAEAYRVGGLYVDIPTGQTAQEWANDTYSYICNRTGDPNCRPCGGAGQEVCPVQSLEQGSTVTLLRSCEQVRQYFPTNASSSCRVGNDGIVTGEASAVREGTTCSLFSSVVMTVPRVECSLCGVYPEAACPTTQDYFATRSLSDACNSFKSANVSAANATCN